MSFISSKSFFTNTFLLCIFQISFSQQRELGTWKSFMPYGTSLGVFDAGDKIYSSSSQSIFSYSKNTGEIRTYDKSSGLSDIGIKTTAYDLVTKFFVIAYTDNNLDLIYNETDIYNIPDIKNAASAGTFGINSISFYNGNAYISCDLGIIVVNLSRKEISNTYLIGANGTQTKVYATAIDGTTIYAATQEGVKHAPLVSPNLQNFNSWILVDSTFLPKGKSSFIATFNNKIYTVIGHNGTDTLFEYNGSNWINKFSQTLNTFTSLNVVNGDLYFTAFDDNGTTAGKNGKIDALGNLTITATQNHARPTGWFESNGISWEADAWTGFYKNKNGNAERIVPDGPFTSAAINININDNTVYICSGGATESWDPIFIRDGIFVYKNNTWKNYNQYSNPELENFPAIISSAIIPQKQKAYFASFLYGIAELDLNTGAFAFYNKDNTPTLELTSGSSLDTRISAITADRYNNLWIANAGATKPIKLLKSNGEWKEFAIPFNFGLMKKIVIDQNDQIWAPLRTNGSGLLVWSYNQTIDDISDDRAKVLYSGAGAGNLPDPNVYAVAEDKDGNMWIGTDKGIAVFYCPGNILTTTGCDADLIKVERDGYIGYLFSTESVRAIAVDAANRKWIGTTTGLWLISDDGKKELLKFNTDNSPLPNNQITDIAIDDKTGEVFIGTLGGLVSYQGDAMGECTDCTEALVYPNPVKPDYTGPIAIKGLTQNAYVKITDITGTLIYQGKANGTQMIWDGKGYNGSRAKSGVYLVFSSTDLGKERRVAKILLTN